MQLKICEKANAEAFAIEGWKFPDALNTEIDYYKLRDALFSICKELEENKKESLAHNIALVAHLCGMGLQVDEPGAPFRALATWTDGSRTATTDDLSQEHLLVLEKAASLTDSPIILARVNDVLWLKQRPPQRERTEFAIANYIALSAEIRRSNIAKITYASTYLKRSIQLWRQLGSAPKTRAEIEGEIESCMMLTEPEPSNFIRFHFYDLLPFVFDEADLKKWITLGDELVEISTKQKNFEKARSYLETERNLFKIAKDSANATKAKERHTDLFVLEAREMKTAKADPMILQSLYNKAIEACRNTPGKGALAKELHAELVEIQKQIPGNLKQISEGIDLKPAIDQILEAIRERGFSEALEVVALKAIPPQRTKLFAEAEKLMNSFPLQSLITTVLLDEKGKVIAQKPGMGSSPEERAAAIRARASENFLMGVELKGTVLTWAQRELNNRIDCDERVIEDILYPNPFVPPSRIEQFKRGLLTGLKGDWISCISILVPQLENSLRQIMQIAGHNMVSIDSEGIQQEKDLNSFIYSDEFKALVGEDMQFQLQVLLCDKTGLNLRNNVAHGLLTDGAALSGSSAFVWALTLMLCMTFQKRYYSARVSPTAEQSEAEPE